MDDRGWETEALRESAAARRRRPSVSQDRRPTSTRPAEWVTLREASDATGIPVGTLGSWARRGAVDSYLAGNGGRKVRIVDLNDVRYRAHELGRPVAPVPVRAVERVTTPEPRAEPPRAADDNMMIVPLDAWTKMLNQLGNLHEAGQQLAEARERAAKAETEAAFLRERLAELRAEAAAPAAPTAFAAAESPMARGEEDEASDTHSHEPPPEPIEEPWMPAQSDLPAETPELEAVGFWRSLVDTWRRRS
jgi:hypothetical protein